MTGRSSPLWSLVGTGLRGLRSRFLLTVGSVLLAAISVAAAVVGPMYQVGAASSYLVTRLRAEPNFLTGEVLHYLPTQAAAGGYVQALEAARRLSDRALNDKFEAASGALWTERLFTPTLTGDVALLSKAGQCRHVALVGRCPTRLGEALILRSDSSYADRRIGDTIEVPGVHIVLHIVGMYSSRARDETFWFDLGQLASEPPAAPPSTVPYQPAPFLVAPQTFDRVDRGQWFVKATKRLVITPRTSLTDLQAAAHSVEALHVASARAGGRHLGEVAPEPGNQLSAISRQVRKRQSTARSTVAPAVVSVDLVALVLLLRLLTAAMELRRSELALASLRGYSRGQMWLLGLVEPVLMVLIATPLGLVGGYLCAQVLARTWLVPGLPVSLGWASLLALLAVALATLVVATLVVRDALSETLSRQIAGVRRPGRSGRWGLILQLVIVAASVVVLVATLAASKRSSPDATDLALPILLAVAAGLLTTFAAQTVARWWASWTAQRRGVFSYLASRTISRRREGTLVILPLTAALAVSIFAAGVFTAAADWRASDAATIVGAERSYPTQLSMGRAVALTHQIDPSGSWLMATASEFDGLNQILVMDTPRLPRVGLWPSSWTPGMDARQVSQSLSTHRPAVTLHGSRITMTVDNQVSGDFRTLSTELSMTGSDGLPTSVVLGPMPRGVSTVSAALTDCESGCVVTRMSFGGPAVLAEAMHGTATIMSVRCGGKPVPGFVDESWLVARPLLSTPQAVAGTPRVSGDGLTVAFDAANSSSYSSLGPGDVPLTRPVLLGRTAHPDVDRGPGDVLRVHVSAYLSLDVRPVIRAESMPILGPVGMMVDYTMLTRDVAINDGSSRVVILARSDTPSSVVAALADHGISDPETLSTTRSVLDNDAFALALNLYLVVTGIVILLALAGLAASLAVQMPARRHDAASLRVVGLRRRSIIAAVVTEFTVVLGAAALAGIAAGSLAQYVVVRTITLGYADSEHTPRLLASLNLATVTGLLVVVTVGLLVVAVTVAGATVRGARTASLRENA